MTEGINGFDDVFDEIDDVSESNLEQVQEEEPVQEEEQQISEDEDIATTFLKSKGISDPSKMKFANDNGEIEEVDWNSLDNKEKMNILNSFTQESGLDDSEVLLINAIRSSKLTPAEYIQYVQKQSVDSYIQNAANQVQPTYSVDQYSDEELFVMDLISKSGDITEEEAVEALEKAKSNDKLFTKQMGAIRNEYKRLEEENRQYTQMQQQEYAQSQFNQFAEKIENSIINFKEFSGYDLNMDNNDMQDLYTFIIGTDKAGNNWFSKALNDPDTVVQMAWFILNGEKMIQDMNEYYQKEITNVRKESYNKGLKDAGKKDKVTYKPKTKVNRDYDDLDDF